MKKNYILAALIGAVSMLGIQKVNAQTDARSILVNGTTQIATVPDNVAYHFGTNVFTVECWIKANVTQTNYPMAISKRLASSAFTGFGFGLDPSGKVWAQINGSNYIPGLGANLKDNTCHHIALTRSKGATEDTLKFYVDGAFIANAPMASSYDATDTGPLYIGGDLANPGNNMYAGNVNEVRLWNYVRTPAEISANKSTEVPGLTTGLVGYWRLNEGTGQVINDISSIANNGTLGATSAVESTDPVWSTSCAVATLTGIEDYSIDHLIKIYPNPATSVLNITGITAKTTIRLYDIVGKLVMETSTDNNITVDAGSLEQGIYTIVTESSEGRSFNKVIIQK
ncbi:MAG: LamG-like jellyroll fold domain-containing protein [Bacteroidia bacterium]